MYKAVVDVYSMMMQRTCILCLKRHSNTRAMICVTTSVQLKMSNPQHSSGCGLRGAVGVWLYSIWIELKDLQ